MSIVESIIDRLVIRAVAPRPQIRKEAGILVLESTWRTALFTLGGRHRKVSVDPSAKVVRVLDRTFWFIGRSRRIEFDWIEEIIYGYHDLLGSNWFSHTAQELFTVGLKLKDRENLILFRLFGEGEFINNSLWPDWMYWEDIIPGQIVDNSSEGESRRLAEVLSGLIGVPIGNGDV